MVMPDWRKPVLGGQNKFHTPPQIELNYRQNLYNHRPSIEAGSAPASLQYKEECTPVGSIIPKESQGGTWPNK